MENTLARICKFKILKLPYRQSSLPHWLIFRVCAQIAQLDIYYNPLRAGQLEDREYYNGFLNDDNYEEQQPEHAPDDLAEDLGPPDLIPLVVR